MKKIFLSFLLSVFFSFTFSQKTLNIPKGFFEKVKKEQPQSIVHLSKTSNYTRLMFLELKKLGWTEQQTDFILPDSIATKYFLVKQGVDYIVNSFIVLKDTTDFTFLHDYNIQTGSRSRNILTGFIPLKQFDALSANPKVKYIEIGTPVEEKLDNARSLTNVNQVQQGVSLPQAYDGSGVIVGVIDEGIDFTHPTFYNDAFTATRIKRVWEQTVSGTPPTQFTYGRELSNPTAILNAHTDNTAETHGTHTTGIAAGSGLGTSGSYRGIAPLSDIVLVARNSSNVGVINGIDYILNYANSQNKPAVVNMSLGSHMGPHDGTSVFDIFCDGIVSSGNILVGAAGNEGDKAIHFFKDFNASDTVGYTFLDYTGGSGLGGYDFWSNENFPFYVRTGIYNINTNQFEDYTPWYPVISTDTLVDSLFDFNGVKQYVYTLTEINTNNNKPHATVFTDTHIQPDAFRYTILCFVSWGGFIDGWCSKSGNLGDRFANVGYPYPVIQGDSDLTVAEIGGTGNRIISVGAYTSKNSYTDIYSQSRSAPFYSQNGAVAPFSSKGPTADGRIKPDITAPGNVVVSAVNRFNPDYIPNPTPQTPTDTTIVFGVTDNINNWYYATEQGTSMASPVVAGIVALWLQAYPNLTPEQAKTLLKNSAIHDSYTGAIPSGSYTWGWGKANAWLGMQQLLNNIPTTPSVTGNASICQGQSTILSAPTGYSAYLWSTGATTQSINVNSAGSYSVRATNSSGYISPWSNPKVVTINPLVTPSVSISPNTTQTICSGEIVSFNASPTNGGSNPTYQWYLDNNLVGSGATYTTPVLSNNSSVYCKMTSNENCANPNPINSSTTAIVVISSVTPTVSITANPSGTVCPGTNLTFIATPTGGGNNPTYQWKVNNIDYGTGSSYSSSTLNAGDYVHVVLTSNASCASTLPVTSNAIQVSIWGPAIANAGNDDTIIVGNSTILTATGGVTYQWSDGNTSPSITVSPLQTTTYTVTVWDNHSCTATDSVTVFVLPACNHSYVLDSTTATVPASGGNCSTNLITGAACSWNVNAGGCSGWVSPINLSGTGTANISFTVQQNTLPSQRTCFAMINDSLFSIIQLAAPTDVQELLAIRNIFVSPNPNNGTFTLKAELTSKQELKINLFNSIGQIVCTKNLQENSTIINVTFDLSNNSSGVYYLQLNAGGNYYYKKIIVE